MSVVRLYLDEDAAQRDLVVALRLHGADITTAQEQGLVETPDPAHLEWCHANGRVLYTFNVRHFFALHTVIVASAKHHAGIIVAPRQRYSVGEQMRRLLRLTGNLTADQMRNRVEFLTRWG